MPLRKTPPVAPKQGTIKELSNKMISKINKNPKAKAAFNKLSDANQLKVIGKNLLQLIKTDKRYSAKAKQLFGGLQEGGDVYDADVKCPDGKTRSLKKMAKDIHAAVKKSLSRSA